MAHTESIIDKSCSAWGRLCGVQVYLVRTFSLPPGDELCEIELSLGNDEKAYICWTEESEEHDFYWISCRQERHYSRGAVREKNSGPAILESLIGTQVEQIQLFGNREVDAVLASRLVTANDEVIFATTTWNPKRQTFLSLGREELAVLTGSEFRAFLSSSKQDLELLVTLPPHIT